MQVESLGTPCRAFAFMSGEYIPMDPKDGREKYVMGTSSAHTLNSHIVLFDPDTLEAEDIETPGDVGIWALLYLPEYERLLVGTAGYYGWLHCLDMKTRTWMRSLRLEGQTYIWNLVRGGDGLIYGSNWPGSILYCYDPKNHTLTSAGRAGSNPENRYSRMVYTLPDGNILISVGMKHCESYVYDVREKTFQQVFEPGDYATRVTEELIVTSGMGTGNGYRFYDVHTLTPLTDYMDSLSAEGVTHPAVVRYLQNEATPKYYALLPYRKDCSVRTLRDGRQIGYFNNQVILIENETLTFHDVPVTAPPMRIHSMQVDPEGVVWFGAGIGESVGWYDPRTGESWNSPAITNANGDVYGIVPYNGRMYFTAYAGGDHVVYDPQKPWDQFSNTNPKTLRSVMPQKMQRPIAGSIIGPDGNVWTGWCGTYGIYGGGISRIDVNTDEVTAWFGVVPEQSIRHMAASDKYLYATSHWMNSGLAYRFDDEFRLLRLDTECNILWSEQFAVGQHPECLLILGGRLYMSMRDRRDGMAKLYVYDEQTMERLAVKVMNPLGDPGKYEMEQKSIRHLLPYSEDKLVVLIDNEAHLMDALTLQILQTVQLPGLAEVAAEHDKTVYFSVDEKLYKVTFD